MQSFIQLFDRSIIMTPLIIAKDRDDIGGSFARRITNTSSDVATSYDGSTTASASASAFYDGGGVGVGVGDGGDLRRRIRVG